MGNVRSATVEDLAAMIRLDRQCPTAAHWAEERYQELFTNPAPARLVLIEHESSPAIVVGFLVARHLAPEWELENIVVTPSARRTGVGTRLMEALLVQAHDTNSESIFLEVRKSNIAARRLYEKLGFDESGRRKAYYASPAEDAVLYAKSLR